MGLFINSIFVCNDHFMEDLVPIEEWGFGKGRPFVIAGPCGAETRDQVMDVARELAASGKVNLFRAGVWKPRTRPGVFEGAGEEALEWLKEMKQETGLAFTVEVATPAHTEAAMNAGADALWIGARTTVNPFLVQEIAHSLHGIDIPVLIKNPVNPDINLWLGAIERFSNSGLSKLAAIHRGFSSYENSSYRNKPTWEIPIELKRRLPQLPLICDPSHICGTTEPLGYISQFALDLNFDGLMLESHPDPHNAWSDPDQQVRPVELIRLLDGLVSRELRFSDVVALSKLEDLRDQIDEIDDEIIRKLAHRMSVARLIGEYKHQNNVTILQPERWNEIIQTRTAMGTGEKLTEEFLQRLYNLIHEESIVHQTMVMQKHNKALKDSERTDD